LAVSKCKNHNESFTYILHKKGTSISHYKVIIIGAGPSGTAAAMTLSKHKIPTCIIDKSAFPRDKLCGGLLTLRSKKIFDKIFTYSWENIVDYRSSGVSLYEKDNLLRKVNNYTNIYFTKRYIFDQYLLDNCIHNGVDSYLDTKIKNIDLDNNTLLLSNNTALTYDYLIGADGANSLVAKTLFGRSYDPKKIGFALEVEVPKEKVTQNIDNPEIYFNIIEHGYAWVFPKKETLTVGMGGNYQKNKSLKNDFEAFLKQKFNIENVKCKGAFIPFGYYRKKPMVKNVFLCGDAAGLVDPVTGEGIAYALESGHEVARSILSNTNISQSYKERYKVFTSEIRIARFISFFLFSQKLNGFILNKIHTSHNSVQIFLDLLTGDVHYKALLKTVFKKLFFQFVKRKHHV
jgi:geranylgeranyl reductase family protein